MSKDVEKSDFPEPIVHMIKALDDKQRRQILIALKGRGELSWSELLEKMTIEKGTLNHHLNELEAAGMIRNFSKENPTSGQHSYYEITNLATRVIDGLFGVFRPQKTTYTPPSPIPGLGNADVPQMASGFPMPIQRAVVLR
ncbi:MAG: ArsR/SmtB family transcription factor [Nitrososphaerales archaeon]